MLAKRTGANQLTFLEEADAVFGGIEYFDVTKKDGCIVLTPVHISPADAVREKLAKLGITEADVEDAIAWARRDSGG
jgi:hypothetical protein